MTHEQYEKYTDEFLKFDRVQKKTSHRRDLHAFNLLDKLVTGVGQIICSAEHDQIWLDINPEDLVGIASEDQIIELIRCGVMYDGETDMLSMFV